MIVPPVRVLNTADAAERSVEKNPVLEVLFTNVALVAVRLSIVPDADVKLESDVVARDVTPVNVLSPEKV